MDASLLIVMLGTMTVTSYRAVPNQTDVTPNWTSISHHVHSLGAAASPDMIKSGQICYGDVVQVPGIGLRVINDTMNPRLKRTIDVFVDSKPEESQVGVRNIPVNVIQSERRYCSRAAFMKAQNELKRYSNAQSSHQH